MNAVEVAEGQSSSPPLIAAAKAGQAAVVTALLNDYSADPNPVDADGMSALGWAAAKGQVKVASALLSHDGIAVNQTSSKGDTPLIIATKDKRSKGVLQKLVGDQRVDVGVKDGAGHTALTCAAQHGHDTIIKLLMKCTPAGGATEALVEAMRLVLPATDNCLVINVIGLWAGQRCCLLRIPARADITCWLCNYAGEGGCGQAADGLAWCGGPEPSL